MTPKQVLVAVGGLALIAINFFVGTGGKPPVGLTSTGAAPPAAPQAASFAGLLFANQAPATSQVAGTLAGTQVT